MLKLHKLLLNAGHPDCFDEAITPTEQQRQYLRSAKNDIRGCLLEKIRAASVTVLGMDRMVSPRFRTQGSWTYKTCVQPAQHPPQEIDWDFGVYLPVTMWTERDPPHRVAKLYFDLVEAALADLCRDKGWTLDSSNAKCVRVKVASWAHIDVPLYAAPEHKFREIAERAVVSAQGRRYVRDAVALDESVDFGEMPEQFWEEMDGIHMALRTGEWKPSDPEAVARWFNDQVEEHGLQLRRICRYVKAWRDLHWSAGGPTSVLLMIVVAQSFREFPRRDDLALEHAARSLVIGLANDVREKGIDLGEENFNRLDAQQRVKAVDEASKLANKLKLTLSYGTGMRHYALINMQELLGARIASQIEWVEADDGADTVRNTAAAAVVQPVVGATKAG